MNSADELRSRSGDQHQAPCHDSHRNCLRRPAIDSSSPERLLDLVEDRDSFINFVRALAEERSAAAEIERRESERYVVDGALDWKNADLPSYLYACLEYFEERPFHKPESAPSWQMFAQFLYFGKIIE